jgi:hypothetical protein
MMTPSMLAVNWLRSLALLEPGESQDVYARLAQKPILAHQKESKAAKAAIIAVAQAG